MEPSESLPQAPPAGAARPRVWAWAGLAAAGLGLTFVCWPEPRPSKAASDSASTAASGYASAGAPQALPATGQRSPVSALSATGTGTDVDASANPQLPAPPPGVSPEQWQAFVQSLEHHPQRAAEIERVLAFLAYQQNLERFRALRSAQTRGKAASQELKAIAQTLDASLNERLAAREVSAGEAAMLKAALAEAMGDGPTQAQVTRATISAWRASVAAPAAAPDARERAFVVEQEQLMRAWQAQPAGQRDPQALEAALEAARQRHFAAPAPANAPTR
jgi:hypothetical protein